MSELLAAAPFSRRDDAMLLREMNALNQWHRAGCAAYRAVWPEGEVSRTLAELPFLHVGVFKHRLWSTEAEGIQHLRTLKSSSTGGAASQIALDSRSSALQARSSAAILEELLGTERRPLLLLEDVQSLRQRGEVGARVTAAMSLRPLSSEIQFLLGRGTVGEGIDWQALLDICARNPRLLVYGFTWMLWVAWAQAEMPGEVREALAKTRVHFVHSGGWKKLEAGKVSRERFDSALLGTVAPGSGVLEFYGLVEQVGIIYPRCVEGYFHVPRWAAVLARDPWALKVQAGEAGMLQLMNCLAFGAPYHNVLTEDLGIVIEGACACGREGQRFELLGRMPEAELRGCSNV